MVLCHVLGFNISKSIQLTSKILTVPFLCSKGYKTITFAILQLLNCTRYQTARVLPRDQACLCGTPRGLGTPACVGSLTNCSVPGGYHPVTSWTHCGRALFIICTSFLFTIKIYTILFTVVCAINKKYKLDCCMLQFCLQKYGTKVQLG